MPGPITYGLGWELVRALRLDQALPWPLPGLAAKLLSRSFTVELYAPHGPRTCHGEQQGEEDTAHGAGEVVETGELAHDFDFGAGLFEVLENVPKHSCIRVADLVAPNPIKKKGKIALRLGPLSVKLDVTFDLNFDVLPPTRFALPCGEPGACHDDCYMAVLRTVLTRAGTIQIEAAASQADAALGDLDALYGAHTRRTQAGQTSIEIELSGEEQSEVTTKFLVDPMAIRVVPPDVGTISECRIPIRSEQVGNPAGVTITLDHPNDDCNVMCEALFAGQAPRAESGSVDISVDARYIGPRGTPTDVHGSVRLGILDGRIVRPANPRRLLLDSRAVVDGCSADSYGVSLTVLVMVKMKRNNQITERTARRAFEYRHACDRINQELVMIRESEFVLGMRLRFVAMCDPQHQ